MIFKFFYHILLMYINLVHCNKFSLRYPLLLKNNSNFEPKVLKLLEGEVSKSGDELNYLQNTTTNEIIGFEEDFEHYRNIDGKETVHHFYLFTREYHNGVQYEILNALNVSTITNSHFKLRKTFILIHGFGGNGLEEWITTLKNKLLMKNDCNVIIVDWPAGSYYFPPIYFSVIHHVPYVGSDTAALISSIHLQLGLPLELVHCIGHSLGAHVCGFSAKPFLGKIGRITGLDPAGPGYRKMNRTKRLDKSDASYVDVMHTNSCYKFIETDCYGINENIGHSDFYPNGGKHQPACSRHAEQGLKGQLGCDHVMAYFYYIATLDYNRSSTSFLSRSCDDWSKYDKGNCSCGLQPQFMGYNINTELNGTFFLKTHAVPPYSIQDPGCFGNDTSFSTVTKIAVIPLIGITILLITCLAILNIKRSCTLKLELLF